MPFVSTSLEPTPRVRLDDGDIGRSIPGSERSARARPMSLDDRRAMILDAAIPLFMSHGKSVTTRQIAITAGIAEGTVFRAFGDKEAIVDAAVARFLDPAPLRAALRSIDPDDCLESKIRAILLQLRARYAGIFGLLSALRMHGPPSGTRESLEGAIALTEILAPELARLRVDASLAAQFIRVVAFATSIGPIAETHPFSTEELVDLIIHGIAGTCATPLSSSPSPSP